MLPWRDYPTVPVLICLFWLYLISFSSYVQHKKRKTEKAYQLVKLNVLMATAWVATARVVMLNVAWKRLPRKLARFVLFCPFKSVLFILLWVLGLFFFQNAGGQLCFRFFWRAQALHGKERTPINSDGRRTIQTCCWTTGAGLSDALYMSGRLSFTGTDRQHWWVLCLWCYDGPVDAAFRQNAVLLRHTMTCWFPPGSGFTSNSLQALGSYQSQDSAGHVRLTNAAVQHKQTLTKRSVINCSVVVFRSPCSPHKSSRTAQASSHKTFSH